jgi:PKD repeat protein
MAPLTIDLDASHSEGSITQYTWTINGQTLSGQTNSTTLTEAGEYTILLTVTNAEGQTATAQQSVFVWKPGQAIIIAGPKAKDNLFKYSNEFTQRMYRLLKQRGYDDEKIHYLNVLAPDIETPLDGRPEPERQDYNLFDPKKELSEAFAKATANLTVGDQFVLYLHGHAGDNRFELLDEKIPATHLRDLLATIPAGVQQIIILDTCYSGSFIDELAGVAHRVVVTSTDDNSLTFQLVRDSFANQFMHILESGGNVFEAFRTAEDMILTAPKYFPGQRPWLDDDSDGQFLNEGLYAENVHVGLRRVAQAPPPEIKQVHPRITLPENEGTSTLWVKTTDNENIYRVRAVLIPPQYQVREYQGENTDFSRIELPMLYNAVEENYGVKYDGFCDNAGLWQILYQAQDKAGAWSEIVQGEVQAPECSSPATVEMQLNQSRYTTNNPLRLDMEVNGQATVDFYVAIVFPEGGGFMTIANPLSFSELNAIQIYQPAVEIAGQKTYSIMDFPLPAGIPTGNYQTCGVLVLAGATPMEPNNWIHLHCAGFEVY